MNALRNTSPSASPPNEMTGALIFATVVIAVCTLIAVVGIKGDMKRRNAEHESRQNATAAAIDAAILGAKDAR